MPGPQGPDAVYVFVQTNDSWVETVKPLPGNCTVEDYFGEAVAISGDTAIITAQGDDVGTHANQGTAYIFERTGASWNLVKTIAADDGVAGDFFGNSVALSGNTAVVGAYSNDTGANVNQGSAYVYERNAGGMNNWGQVKQLAASDGSAEDWFGWSVGISGNSIVVGAMLDDVGGNGAQGSAYIYERNSGGTNNWGEVKHLFASDGAAFDDFGVSVAASGDTVVVGSFFDDVGANGNQGSVYIYERNNGGAGNWGELRKVTASDGMVGDEFGVAIAIDNNSLIVGAFTDDFGANNNQGSAYVFDRNTGGANNWGQVKKLIAPDGVAVDYFGVSVGISGDVAIVGSQNDQIGSNAKQGIRLRLPPKCGWLEQLGTSQKDHRCRRRGTGLFRFRCCHFGRYVDRRLRLRRCRRRNQSRFCHGFSSAASTPGINRRCSLRCPKPIAEQMTNTERRWRSRATRPLSERQSDDVGINANQGSAYILERNAGGPDNWGVVKLLTASDGGPDEFFGGSVAISGDKVIIGASNDTIGRPRSEGPLTSMSAIMAGRINGERSRK